MMNIFFLILMQAVLLHSFEEVSDIIDEAEQYIELISDLEKKYGVQLNEKRLFVDLSRDIGFGFKEVRLGLQATENDYYFHLSIIVQEDALIAIQLMQLKQEKTFIKKENLLSKYLKSFNEIFQTDKDIVSLKDEFWNWHMFSSGCGFSGEPTDEWMNLEKFRKSGNYEGVKKMLISLNPEIQAYGLIGLLQLKNDGLTLKPNDEKILSYLANRNSDLYTCVGCFPGEIQTTKKLIEYYAK